MGGFILGLVILLIIGYSFGKINEKRHYRQLKEREAKLQNILLFNEKRPPNIVSGQPFYLVSGSVVMSSDYFKQTLAGLKQIFGGRLNSYESMIDRARREAILRMKENAQKHGAGMIFNVHLQTSTIGQNQKGQGIVCTEVLAYGTAWAVTE